SCETIFSTGSASAGIKVGTAITTWVKRIGHQRNSASCAVYSREFWGSAARKRHALVDSLEMDRWSEEAQQIAATRSEGPRPYTSFHTDGARRWKLLPYDIAGGYEDWPSVDQLFGLSAAGINPNRGLDRTVIDTDREALVRRMDAYFSTRSDADFFAEHPELAKSYAGYEPSVVRQTLREMSALDRTRVVPYELFPLDARWLYYETTAHLLNRPRPDVAAHLDCNEFLVLVNQSRRPSETKPLLTQAAFDLHLFDVGAQAFFAERRVRVEQALDHGEPEYTRVANLALTVWTNLARRWELTGDLGGDDAKSLIRALFRVALAAGHSPAFQRDFIGSLAHDWLRFPIPRDRTHFLEATVLGDQVALLLDPFSDLAAVRRTIQSILGPDASRLAVLSTDDGGPIREEDLRVDIAHFGAAPGGWRPRRPEAAEPWRAEWGETTGDLSLNNRVFFRHVPERVWKHELGGYQVIKKWLGYREARRRAGEPIGLPEKDHLRSMMQRLAALCVLEGRLDEMYARAAADAFTVHDLQLD
ncbi:MAG TPA: type ISP restriction/modification enzyme, partial [Gemmatimonadaceae bacterium]|nr:type ISP restriction/modification enzyme [Gemmatimonadaceae bacterium]